MLELPSPSKSAWTFQKGLSKQAFFAPCDDWTLSMVPLPRTALTGKASCLTAASFPPSELKVPHYMINYTFGMPPPRSTIMARTYASRPSKLMSITSQDVTSYQHQMPF
jgi:hypothetical protein